MHILLLFSTISFIGASYPIAIFHGLGASCDLRKVSRYVEKLSLTLNSTQAICIEIGNGILDSISMSIESQAQEACDKIKSMPLFQSNFSIIGLSQGSLIGRYIIEKCEMKGVVRNFVSISGPQMGISSFPRFYCSIFCGFFNFIVEKLINFSVLSKSIAPIGYFRAQSNFRSYDNSTNHFLAELNNDLKDKRKSYRDRMLQLEKVVLIMNEDDRILHPPSSAWFEFYDRWGNFVVPLKKSRFYLEDFIGLRKLDEMGKVDFVKLPGRHLYITDKQIDAHIAPNLR
jgi:palmitoyl-protein thioesterase